MSENAESLEDLGPLHDSIMTAIRERFGARLKNVAEYDPIASQGQTIVTPAVLLELVEIRPAGGVTGGRTPLELNMSAHCVLSAATDNVQREIRNFAAQLLCLVDGNRWGLGSAVTRAGELEAFPGMFTPGEKGFESWVVNWKQTVHLGSVWSLPPETLPQTVWLGQAPNIGPGNESSYVQVTDGSIGPG
ncbi:hypothetical protein ACX3YG_14320 [Pseudomonas wadenswilerensis]